MLKKIFVGPDRLALRRFLLMAVAGTLAAACGETPTTAPSADPASVDDDTPSPVGFSSHTTVPEGLTLRSLGAATGTQILAAGTGTRGTSEESLSLTIPAGVTVQKVLLYWTRRIEDLSSPPAAEIEVGLTSGSLSTVGGAVIGGPLNNPDEKAISYLADVTGAGLLSAGGNTVYVKDSYANSDGASLLVLVDDGSSPTAEISVYDGLDFAYFPAASPFDDTEPVVFSFAPASSGPRTARLILLVGDTEPTRPSYVEITVGGTTTTVGPSPAPFPAADGDAWDTFVRDISVPAGVGQVSVQLFSGDGTASGGTNPESLVWATAALSITPEVVGGEGCTPGYWRNHHDAWEGASPGDLFTSLGFSADWDPQNPERNVDPASMTLGKGVTLRGGGVNALVRHAVAAWLNASHSGVDFGMTAAQVVDAFNAAVGSGGDIEGTKDDFVALNESGCSL